MLNFLNLKPEAFGLDISDLSLKIINLEKKGKDFKLASIGETQIKEGVIRGGEIKDKETLTKNIKRAVAGVRGKKIGTKYVMASLPEEKSFLQVIQMPKILKEDLKSAVIFEAENYIPLPIEEVYFDSQIVEPVVNHLDHYDVLISALPKKTVDPYVECLKAAGLKPLALEIESLPIARSLLKDELAPFPVLLIDLGATRTSSIIFSGHSLRFTFSIPVSSRKFSESIARSMKVDIKEAERLKIKYGLQTNASKEGGEVFDALIPPLTDLIEQIKKCLDYYQSHSSHEHLPPNGQNVKKVFLCGGGANLKGLTSLLSQQLELPVEIGNPWINVVKEGKPLEESLKYATAIGLALRGIKYEN